MRQRAKKVEMDGRNDVELLLDELETLLQKDPSSHVSIGESKGSIESVLFQTGSMRDTYRRFPEVLLLDGTYTVNKNRMPRLCMCLWLWMDMALDAVLDIVL